tara:strand:- start:4208 stop:4699 length:492 start_codon:yes stop_codon:yes gene_type:complete
MYNKIRNPETNRNVSIFSKKGQTILLNFITKSQTMQGGGINDTQTGAKELTIDTMKSKVFANNGEKWFVKFYAPWCGHCNSMEDDWNKAANSTYLKTHNVHLGSFNMDISDHKTFAEKHQLNIRGFPTLKLFENENSPVIEFNRNQRNTSEFINFVKQTLEKE